MFGLRYLEQTLSVGSKSYRSASIVFKPSKPCCRVPLVRESQQYHLEYKSNIISICYVENVLLAPAEQ